MKKILLITLLLTFFTNINAQKTYKKLMNDYSVNFYDVCKEAELYFETHDKNIKGSGWKGYQRWRNANEYKFYPSGIRNNIDLNFPEKAYNKFLKENLIIGTKSLFSNGWEELGPFRIDSLTGHYSAGLGQILDHYVNPNNTDIMYTGSRSGGFWKTTNGGTSWKACTDFIYPTGVNTFGVSPTNSDSILINVQNSKNNMSHGIYRSIDGGETWSLSNFNPNTINFGGLGEWFKIFEIRYHPRVPNLVFIGTSKGVYRSDDNLATWTREFSNSDIVEIQFHPTDNNIIYLYDSYIFSNSNYVLRSTDQGINYSQSSLIVGNNNNTSVHLSVSNACEDCLYFASDNGIWKSTNKGIDFTFVHNPDESCGGFAVNDNDTSNMIYGYVDIEAKLNAADTFHRVTRWSLGNTNGAGNGNQSSFKNSTNYVHADLHPAKCINGVFYIGTDGLFCKSEDGGANWEIIGQGIAVRENYKLGISQSNHYKSISGSQDNGSSIKHKDDWIEFYGADGMEGIIHPLNDDYIIGSLQSGGRRRTTNGGQTQGGATPSGSESGYWEAPLAYDPNNQMTILDFRENIYKSEDFGLNHTNIGSPSFSGLIKQAAIAENNSDIIVVANGFNIERSIDGGLTFSSIKNNLPSLWITDIAFDPNDDDVIIVVNAKYQNNGKKIYLTTDGGNTWTNITYNLGDMPIHSVVIDHTDSSQIYIGAEIGVFTKSMNGNHWVLYNNNLPNCAIEELEINYGSNTLKAATWGRGLWEYSLKGRVNYPSILTTKISNMPTLELPKETMLQYVTSVISYENNLSNVYLEWSINTPTFGNVINMSNISDSTWISDTPIPDFTDGTKVYFKVFAIGTNNDTTETYKFMYKLKEFAYCNASGTMNYDGNITLVDFNTINKPSGKTQAYSNYTQTDSTALIQGQTYPITVNLKTDNGNYKYYSKVWIDWNKNATFENEESYELGFSQNVNDGPTNLSPFNITVPQNATVGKTRMRVMCKYNNYPSACDNGIDGEVEDYSIIIKERPDLTYQINSEVICLNEYLHFNYTGVQNDSIEWEISNNIDSYVSKNNTDSILLTSNGVYNLILHVYIGEDEFVENHFSFVRVNKKYYTANKKSCKASDEGVEILNLTSKFGCDSIVSITTSYQNLNAIISQSNYSIYAEPTGQIYQWLDCDKEFQIIENETSQIFNPSKNGNFAVKIFDGNCIDTSECVQITSLGILNNTFETNIEIYPNPTDGKIKIILEKPLDFFNIKITNIVGQQLFLKTYHFKTNINIDMSLYNNGIYFLELNTKEKKSILKIIKE